MIEKAKFTFFPLGKAFEKHKNNWRSSRKTKVLEEHGKELVKSNNVKILLKHL